MAFEFRLPDLAEGMAEGEVVKWKVKEGEKVALDQPIVEMMTDKATVEIPSPRAGILSKQNYKEGDVVKVGAVLFVIEEGEGASTKSGNGAHAQTTTKLQHRSPVAAQATAAAEPPQVVDASPDRERVRATPATRRLARQLNVDLAAVEATGPRGRVSSEDVRHAAGTRVTKQPPMGEAPPPMREAPPPRERAKARDSLAEDSSTTARIQHRPDLQVREERIPFRGLRRRIAENMTRSAFTATHFTYVEEVDVTELVELRSRGQARAEARGIKVTYLPFIIKAVVAGLKKYPQLNATLDEGANEIVRKFYYHIGIAAQGPKGLMVTVIRDADRMSIFQLAKEIERLGELATSGRATPDELTGSTFTISSLGKLGGLMATPIINFPEVGVMGVHKIEPRPAVVDNEIQIRQRMNLSISLDHRVVDGWDGAMFLQEVKGLLEDPTTMFMELV
jgi:pyruvate dehydrogenase E2 component (dihydrolipoamide acetyltransferase)